MEFKTKYKVLLISIAISTTVMMVSMFLGFDASTLGNILVICLFVITIPFFLCEYTGFIWLKSVERQFPNFIRDLADSNRSGMSLPEAVRICSRTNYGKLTDEIQRISNRLTWGTSFIRSMEIFKERVKKSKIITDAIEIINESYTSGGNITATLDSVAKDIRTLQDAEEERRGLVRQHMMIMYAIFFIFLGVSLTIIFVMVPMMGQTSETDMEALAFKFVNPCPDACEEGKPIKGACMPIQNIHFPCNLFFVTCAALNVESGISCYYVSLFFFILMIQGVFSGLIAGQLGENSVVAGGKHSIIMVSAALSIFMVLAKMGLLPQ